jgi:hypothetical protein
MKVDPGKPPELTWQRKLNNEANAPSEFTLSIKEMIHLVSLLLTEFNFFYSLCWFYILSFCDLETIFNYALSEIDPFF